MKSFAAKLEAFINSTDEKTRRGIEAIIQSGVTSYQDWLALIANPEASSDSRIAACGVISQIGNGRAFSALGRALQDENPQVRSHAAGSLAHLRLQAKRGTYPAVLDVLVHAFQSDPELDVRVQAAFALREFHDPRSLEPLIAVVANRREPDPVRDVAAEALAYIPDKRSIPPMIEALKDPAEVVRISAAYTLGSLAGAHAQGSFTGSDVFSELQRAVAPLIEALHDPSEKVRYWAAYALGDMDDSRAISELQRVADTDKGTWYGDEVAEAARYAIQKIQASSRGKPKTVKG